MKARRRPWNLALAAGLLTVGSSVLPGATSSPARPAPFGSTLVYFGTYTEGKSHGVYVSRLDPATGRLGLPGLAAESVNPSFLAVHPSGRFLYAANEMDSFEGAAAGAASAFSLDPATGQLKLLDQVSTRGPGPCYVSLDGAGRHLFIANYDGGSVAVLPVAEDGKLGPASAFVQHRGAGTDPKRQEGPHRRNPRTNLFGATLHRGLPHSRSGSRNSADLSWSARLAMIRTPQNADSSPRSRCQLLKKRSRQQQQGRLAPPLFLLFPKSLRS